MLKKVIFAVAAIAVSSAALAHDGRGDEREHERARDHRVEWRDHRGERFHEVRQPVCVEQARPALIQPAPRVAYAPPRLAAYPQRAPSIDIHLPL
jgi:hypothetical protein